MKLLIKGLSVILILFISITSINQHNENKRLKIYINQLYTNGDDQLINEYKKENGQWQVVDILKPDDIHMKMSALDINSLEGN